MKIDYAIVSSNDDPLYLDFWEIVKPLWLRLGIKPVLVKIDEIDDVIENENFIIYKFKKIENVNVGLQAQISRLYVTKFFKNKICLTSDIDMFPISKSYFVNDIEKHNNDSLIIFSSDAYGDGRYPMCYNAASGELFNNILKLDDTFKDFCLRLSSMDLRWDTDEMYFGKMVNDYPNQNLIIKLKRGFAGYASNRIDRACWGYSKDLLKDAYIDCHSLRPYISHKNVINNLVKDINECD